MLEKKLKNEIISDLENVNKDNVLATENKVAKLFSVLKLKYGIKEESIVNTPTANKELVRLSKKERVREIFIDKEEDYLMTNYGLSAESLTKHAYNYEYVFTPKRIGGILSTFRTDFEIYVPEQIIRELKLTNGTIVRLLSTDKIIHAKPFYRKDDFEVVEHKHISIQSGLKTFLMGLVQAEVVRGTKKLYVETDIFYNPIEINSNPVKYYLERHDIQTLRLKENDIIDLSWYEDGSIPTVSVNWKYLKKFTSSEENLEYVRHQLYSGLEIQSMSPLYSYQDFDFSNYEDTIKIDKASLNNMKEKLNAGFNIRRRDENSVYSTHDTPSDNGIIPLTLKGKRIVLVGSMNKNTSLESMLESRGAKVSILTDSKIKGQNDIIRNSDLIVFYTSRISHSDYNRMKNVADMNDVKILHFDKTNNEELLKLIYSEFKINSSI